MNLQRCPFQSARVNDAIPEACVDSGEMVRGGYADHILGMSAGTSDRQLTATHYTAFYRASIPADAYRWWRFINEVTSAPTNRGMDAHFIVSGWCIQCRPRGEEISMRGEPATTSALINAPPRQRVSASRGPLFAAFLRGRALRLLCCD